MRPPVWHRPKRVYCFKNSYVPPTPYDAPACGEKSGSALIAYGVQQVTCRRPGCASVHRPRGAGNQGLLGNQGLP